MLSNEQIHANKIAYIEVIQLLKRDFNKDVFVTMLEGTDFFQAPASTKYHAAYKGGLCEHSLNVWKNLVDLVNMLGLSDKIEADSLAIVALCHDLAKINFYTIGVKNQKVYSESGSKTDSIGKFDWVSVPTYTVKDASDRFIYANHEITSEMIARSYIPLTYEESIAILHHHAGMSFDSAQNNIGEVFTAHPLSLLLHIADMMSAYLTENKITTNE